MSTILKPNPNDPDEVITDDNATITANSSDPAYQKDSYSSSEQDDKQPDVNPSDTLLKEFEDGVEAAGEEPTNEVDSTDPGVMNKYKTDEELDTSA
ncbi:hypothetical protein KC669_02720 [Candidatus Dojkabacteria bacterium]|uniref:Uncharacterized protein n=1 Tax=Candidatus Dojkabacteria bacterium TaxID=2099670 RepID=A0A955LB61_9BACT|nr:hypothetical protein [Candidatus Dojkabacteria bacterium]